MTRKFRVLGAAALSAGLALASSQALANGGAFFSDMMAEANDPDAGAPFFGFVKDKNGRFVSNALVTLTVKGGELSVAARADKLGLYRIPGFAKTVDTSGIDVTCSKVGYRQTAKIRRVIRGRAEAPVQIDCVMENDKVASN